jgi:hypothetical protein
MSIVIIIINQPVCCISSDSCQTKIFDFGDVTRNQYFYDVNKIHLFGDFLVAECGNPHAFAEYWRMAEKFRLGAGGIDRFIAMSRDIIETVGARWHANYRSKWPQMTSEQLRTYSRTIAVVAGWSRQEEKIIAASISDDPAMAAELPENGFLVTGGCSETSKATNSYLMNLLTRRRMMNTPEKMLQASIMAARHAAKLEYRHTGQPSIGGRVRQMIIRGDAPPSVVVTPVVNI